LAVFSESDDITKAELAQHTEMRPTKGPGSGEQLPESVLRDFLLGVSLRQARRDNEIHLNRNQLRILEAQGVPLEEICQIMKIARATYFRIKSGHDTPEEM
jgi:hypothetical protein